MSSDTVYGWVCHGKDEKMVWEEIKLRAEDDYSVDMDVTHCGICGSDLHTMNGDWVKPDYPVCVGHEITGTCTRVGKSVTNVKVGDRIGVGAQSGSCHRSDCVACSLGCKNLCKQFVGTYNGRWSNGDKSFGGYATKWRGDCRFVFKIPDDMSNKVACTFFCAGVTTFAPLKRYGVTEGSVVGVMGIGGLGHYGILWAKAMGATVVAMSHSDRKKDVAYELGADEFLVTSNKDALAAYKTRFTHILCTGTSNDFKWETYAALFMPNGVFINVCLPEWKFPEIDPMLLATSQMTICGSVIGSPNEIEDMLQFAAEKNVRPWVQEYNMKDANKAIEDFKKGLPRFRFVLEN